MPDCFIVHWPCGGALAWTPGEWPVGLLTDVYRQARGQQTAGQLTWEVVLTGTGLVARGGSWDVCGGRN